MKNFAAVSTDVTKYLTEDANKASSEGVNMLGRHSGEVGTTTALTGEVTNIINVVIGIVGLIAVVMIIVGGVQYTLSAGDSGKVKKAKDTILYGIIGLIIALLAFAIVNFVIGSL